MSTSNSGAGGVKNLRAIFEHKNNDLSTSPPSRGRSPSGSVSSATGRPLSKVRTSFISVERLGETGPPFLSSRKNTMDGTNGNVNGGSGLGTILKGSPFEDYEKANPSEKASQKPTSKTDSTQQASNGVVDRAAAMARKIQSDVKSVASKATGAKPLDTKVASSAQAKKSPITPTSSGPVVKPRGGVAKIQGVMKSAEEAREARAAAAATTETKETKTSVEQKESASKEKPSSPKITKAPRQSLPTRSARLPGAATAPTSASAAKTDSGNSAAEVKSLEKKPVTARGPPRVANATTASSLAKKSSRASLGANTSTTGSERPKSRVSAVRPAADEGFLARMMRPTASTAQKAQSKAEIASPPRTASRRPMTAAAAKTSASKAPRKSLATGASNETSAVENVTSNGVLSEVAEEQSVVEATPAAAADHPAGSANVTAEDEPKDAAQQAEVSSATA